MQNQLLTVEDVENVIATALQQLRGAPLSPEIAQATPYLAGPFNFRPIVELQENGRKKRRTASASNWLPESGEIRIYFERQEPAASPALMAVPSVLQTPIASIAVVKSSPGTEIQQSAQEKQRRQEHLTVAPVESRALIPVAAIRRDLADIERPHVGREVSDDELQQLCLALAEAEKAGKSFIALKWFRDNELTAHGYTWADSLAYRQAVLTKAIEIGAVLTTPIPNPRAPQHPTTTVKLNRESRYTQAVAPRFQPIRTRGGESASEILLRDRGRF